MKKERAVLTVEASIVLTLFMAFVLFLLSFNRVYSAQNIVSHATLQTADAVSAESMIRSNTDASEIENMLKVSNAIYAGQTIEASAFEKITAKNIVDIARKNFIAAVAESESKADAILKKNGVKDGIGGIDLSGSKYDSKTGETIIYVKYTVELQFPIFGLKEFSMTKAAKVTNMGKDTYTLTVRPQDPKMGTTSGTVKVRKGGKHEIVAYPADGYRFLRWLEDGNKEEKRVITVNSDLTFTAIFEKAYYSVDAKVNNSKYGSITGKGSYEYEDVAKLTASPTVKGGYEFIGWDENNNGKVDDDEETSSTLKLRVTSDVLVTAIFKPKPYEVKVRTGGRGIAILSANGQKLYTTRTQGNEVKMTLDYGSSFTIEAQSSDYPFSNWSGSTSGGDMKKTLTVPVNGGTYIANFEQPYISIITRMELPIYNEVTSDTGTGKGIYREPGNYVSESTFLNYFGLKNSMRLETSTNIKNARLTWSTNNDGIVTVDQNGVITANNYGTAVITVVATASDGTFDDDHVSVTVKNLYTAVSYRKSQIRRYYDTPQEHWKDNFEKPYGWFYRYVLTDSPPSAYVPIPPGGKATRSQMEPGLPVWGPQDGYNGSSTKTAYIVDPGYGKVLMFDKKKIIQRVG